MPVSKYKTWVTNEVLTSSDLNASFDQVFDNQQSFGTPRTAAIDMDGQELILDGDADTSITADTDDRIDFRMQGQDLVKFDGTATTAVNGFTLLASATGSPVQLQGQGSDTNIGITVKPKGDGAILLDATTTGGVDIDGAPLILDADGDTSLRETSDDVLALKMQGTDTFIFDGDVASSAHGLTFTSAASGGDVTLASSGAGANINLAVTAKGSGTLKLSSGSGSVTINGGTVTATPGNNAVVVANGSGKLADGWISESSVTQHAAAVGLLGDWALLATFTPSGASGVDIDNTIITSTHFMYAIAYKVTHSVDDTETSIRTDTANGASVDTGASDYSFTTDTRTTGGTAGEADATASLIAMHDGAAGAGVGNAANEFVTGIVYCTHLGDATFFPSFTFYSHYVSAGGLAGNCHGSGHRNSAATINFIRLLPGGGNLSGEVRVYGLRAA